MRRNDRKTAVTFASLNAAFYAIASSRSDHIHAFAVWNFVLFLSVVPHAEGLAVSGTAICIERTKQKRGRKASPHL